MMGRVLFVVVLMMSWVFVAEAQDKLVADLDQKKVQIKTDFNGAELLLFGALDRASVDDIAIIVTGPAKEISVRRKDKIGGIWINTENANVVGIPSFYQILSTRPLADIASAETMEKHKIGFGHIPFELAPHSKIEEGTFEEWQLGLIRNMQARGLWGEKSDSIEVIGDILFRTNIDLPANIVPGEYEVRALHFRDGDVLDDNISTLDVVKSGLSAQVYYFAHEYAPFYGIFAIIFAVSCGWLAAVAFRR